MKLLYFAWVREKVGISEEERDLPVGVSDVADLIEWLKSLGDGYAEALTDKMMIRVAVNQTYAKLDHPVNSNDEVAFFPPVTGG